ncbi:MAG: MscL family protein [Methyloceanibacter sp.]
MISFLIVAFVLFMAVKATNLRRKQEEEPQSEPPPSREVQLLEESGTPWLNPDGRAFRTPAPSLAGLARERIFRETRR